MRKILKVWIEHTPDNDPDTSHYGQYSNTPGPIAIDRKDRGDMGRNEFRYFNPAMSTEETGNPCSCDQDYRRMETLNRGDWCYIGISAKAEVQLTDDTVQILCSGGLWGVESDSSQQYLAEITIEELGQLRAELTAIGFSKRAINQAFASVTTKTQ